MTVSLAGVSLLGYSEVECNERGVETPMFPQQGLKMPKRFGLRIVSGNFSRVIWGKQILRNPESTTDFIAEDVEACSCSADPKGQTKQKLTAVTPWIGEISLKKHESALSVQVLPRRFAILVLAATIEQRH
jgi:hypothetical protein